MPFWSASRIVLHQLPDFQHLPTITKGQVDFISPDQLSQFSLPADLQSDLQSGSRHSPISATFEAGKPVSFCYAGAITESLWDISVDTLPRYRRKRYAALSVAHLIYHMLGEGKRPVWAALEKNPASLQLAHKLGFVEVDELVLFEPRQSHPLNA